MIVKHKKILKYIFYISIIIGVFIQLYFFLAPDNMWNILMNLGNCLILIGLICFILLSINFFKQYSKGGIKSNSIKFLRSEKFKSFRLEALFRSRRFWFIIMVLAFFSSKFWLGAIFPLGPLFYFPTPIGIVVLILLIVLLVVNKRIKRRPLFVLSIIFLIILLFSLVQCGLEDYSSQSW